MSYELTGTLVTVEPINQVSDKFKKQEFVVEVKDGQYSESIKLQLVNDKCSLIDGIAPGQDVKVQFNLRGRRWEKDGKVQYFNSLDAWRVELVWADVPQVDPVAERPIAPEQDSLPF